MPRKSSSLPTDVELEILAVLWQHGPSTVGQVHSLLSADRDTGYSTTLKMIQVMHEKGLLKRDESKKPYVYRPAESQDKTQMKMLDRLANKAFGGVMGRLLVQAISSKRTSPEDLQEIKRLIRQVEREQD